MSNGKSKFEILMETLLEASKSKEWGVAKKEWKKKEIYFVDPESTSGVYETCSCSYYPIKEVIIIKNTHNGNELIIGKCCITKIIDDEKENKRIKAIFDAVKNKKITKFLIEMSYYDDYCVSKPQFETMMNLFRKKKFTEIQKDLYEKLEDRILCFYAGKYKKE